LMTAHGHKSVLCTHHTWLDPWKTLSLWE
jgi:hypothetical protein